MWHGLCWKYGVPLTVPRYNEDELGAPGMPRSTPPPPEIDRERAQIMP